MIVVYLYLLKCSFIVIKFRHICHSAELFPCKSKLLPQVNGGIWKHLRIISGMCKLTLYPLLFRVVIIMHTCTYLEAVNAHKNVQIIWKQLMLYMIVSHLHIFFIMPCDSAMVLVHLWGFFVFLQFRWRCILYRVLLDWYLYPRATYDKALQIHAKDNNLSYTTNQTYTAIFCLRVFFILRHRQRTQVSNNRWNYFHLASAPYPLRQEFGNTDVIIPNINGINLKYKLLVSDTDLPMTPFPNESNFLWYQTSSDLVAT